MILHVENHVMFRQNTLQSVRLAFGKPLSARWTTENREALEQQRDSRLHMASTDEDDGYKPHAAFSSGTLSAGLNELQI